MAEPTPVRGIPDPLDVDVLPGQPVKVRFDRLEMDVSAGTFTAQTRLKLKAHQTAPHDVPELLKLPYFFSVEATDTADRAVRSLQKPVRFTLNFGDLSPKDWGPTIIRLFYFDEGTGRWTRVPGQVDMRNRVLTAEVDHFTDFGLGGDGSEGPSTPPNLEGYQVDLCTGYASATFPLKVPPGTNGMQPSLVLTYNSSAADAINISHIGDVNQGDNTRTSLQASMVGLGWALELGKVFRTTLTDPSDDSIFSLLLDNRSYEVKYYVDGDRYYTKQNEHLRIRKLQLPIGQSNGCTPGEYWLIETKDGTQYRYGYNADSAQRAARWQYGDNQCAWQWCLDQVTDRHGNTMTIEYEEVTATSVHNEPTTYDQAVYPSVIRYTANESQSFLPSREIKFQYSNRTDCTQCADWFTQYYLTKKLDSIEMRVGVQWVTDHFEGGQLVRKYLFGYAYDSPYWQYRIGEAHGENDEFQAQPKLLLVSITETDGSQTPLSLPATSFAYHNWETEIPGPPGEDPALHLHYRQQLKLVDNGYGGQCYYEYERHVPTTWQVLKWRHRVREQRTCTMGASRGVDSTVVRTYTYPLSSYNVWACLDYRGHPRVRVTDTAGNFEETYFYTKDENGKSEDAVRDALKSRAYKVEKYKSGTPPTLVHTTETDWSYVETQPFIWFVKRNGVTETRESSATTKTTYTYDDWGNVTHKYDYLQSSDANYYRLTRSWYFPTDDTNAYIVNKVAVENVYKYPGASGDWVSGTVNYYDESAYWDEPVDGRGRLTMTRRAVRMPDQSLRYVDRTFVYDEYGNRTRETEYNAYTQLVNGSWTAPGNARMTETTYDSTYHTFPVQVTNPLSHVTTSSYDAMWGRPTQVTDPNGAVTDYTYDTFGRLTGAYGPQVGGANGYRPTTEYVYDAPVPVATGRVVTQLEIHKRTDTGGSMDWLYTRRFYDGIGRVVQEYSDSQPTQQGHYQANVTNTHYDSRGLKWRASVPHLMANDTSARLASFLDSDWMTGADVATTVEYDELARPTVTTLPDTTTTKCFYQHWSAYEVDQNGHTRFHDRDSLGRTTRVIEYLGAVEDSEDIADLTLYALTTYAYDELDRLVSVVDYDDYQYNLTHDPDKVTVAITYDELGRKTSLTDSDLGHWTYVYDPIGTLQSQTDAKNQTITFTYDNLKRVTRKWYPACWAQETITSAQKPCVYDLMELRSAVDTDRAAAEASLSTGSWTDDEIVAGKDVRVRAAHLNELRDRIQGLWTAANLGTVDQFTAGAIVASTRVIKASDLTDLRGWLGQYESSPYAATRRARVYTAYDWTPTDYATYGWQSSSAFGKGRRTGMWDGSGRQSWVWDPAGKTSGETRVLDGHSYSTQSTCDALGRVRTLTYPETANSEVLTYAYAANGLLASITSSLGITLVSGPGNPAQVQYNAFDLPTTYYLGNSSPYGTVTHTYYGPDHTCWDNPPNGQYYGPYGAQRSQSLTSGGNTLVGYTMTYDPVGNVASIVNSATGESFTYTYDDLDRLTLMSGSISESYAYSQIGNITTKNGLSYSYSATHKHAVSAYNGASYAYDDNGGMTTRGSQSIKYDPECRPVRVDVSGAAVCRFAYDGDGIRRKRLDESGTIHYLGAYERNLGNGVTTTEVVTKYYQASFGKTGRLVAFRKDGTLYWVGTDHLGSTVRVADASFAPVDGMRYKPYGESRDPGASLQTDHKFTSQIEDQSIGLYWYGARAYDPAIGRFTAPDTVVPEAKNPQALNRYSYCLNNPLKYVDPTGHDPLGPEWEERWREEHPDLRRGPNDDDRMAELNSILDSMSSPTDIKVSSTELFARQVERLASKYTAKETDQFVRALGLVYSGIRYSGSADVALIATAARQVIQDRRHAPPDGLRPDLRDSLKPGENQTHHYVAFLVQGYFQGAEAAIRTNEVRDGTIGSILGGIGVRDEGYNQGDINLGAIGAQHGAALRNGTFTPAGLSWLIRRYLLE